MRSARSLVLSSCFLAFAVFALIPQAALALEFDKFGFSSASATLTSHEAGAHPDFSTEMVMKTDPSSPPSETTGDHVPYATPRSFIVSLPPGLLGNLNAATECSLAQFSSGFNDAQGSCPFSAQVGVATIRVYNQATPFKASIFRVEPSGANTVARLGFAILTVPAFINVHVRSDGDYGLTAYASDIPNELQIMSVATTLWGVPGDTSHDKERLTASETAEERSEATISRSTGIPPAPFITNPTTCGPQLEVGFKANSYQEPEHWVEDNAPLGQITGCESLGFAPGLSLEPTTHAAASPSGALATLVIPQDESVGGRATSQLRDTVIHLPQGLAISPGAADGLAACSAEQVGYEVSPPPVAQCPEASKIANAVIDSPALSRPLNGAVYQRTPEPGHLTRAWLVADELGVHVKVPGEFQLDPLTGQITSLFLDTPQVPVREFELRFKGGPRGVLATPISCGTYQSAYELTPWSGTPPVTGTTPMTFDSNCATGGFTPKLIAGSTRPKAGAFSSLITEIVAESGEQNLGQLRVSLPPGVLARLRGVPLCPDGRAGAGDCPAGSLLGRSSVATGPGPSPLWIPQPGKAPTAVYLAGPYQGAPYSIVVVTPAQAGPFDLGNVVVRVALQVDPHTAQVTAVSDPLPQILEGIPITYRDVRIEIDRPKFALNPTNCNVLEAAGTATSFTGTSAELSSRFQVGGCRKLPFKPKLRLALTGAMGRTGNPALSAKLTMPPHGANIKRVRVTLPMGEQIDNAHINNPCTRVQFNEEACPPKSVLGFARAMSPLLDKPLEGPVYFRSNGGARLLPDLVADLRGQIHLTLVGYIDSKNERIRSTFAVVPDAPVSKFTLHLYGGNRGLLTNSRSLCGSPIRAMVEFQGQNGKVADSNRRIGSSCGRKKSINSVPTRPSTNMPLPTRIASHP